MKFFELTNLSLIHRHQVLHIFCVFIFCSVTQTAASTCSNGGTYNSAYSTCICTPLYWGASCQYSFRSHPPCSTTYGNQYYDNGYRRISYTSYYSSYSFASISKQWYRMNLYPYFVESSSCVSSNSQICGAFSTYAYVIREKVWEPNKEIYYSGISGRRVHLYSAMAYRHHPSYTNCRIPGDVGIPVRILQCSSNDYLYFLQPTGSSAKQYCFDNKRSCPSGFTSIDDTGYELCTNSSCVPAASANFTMPKMHVNSTGLDSKRSFVCTVYDAFTSKYFDGVKYSVNFLFTFANGTRVPISDRNCITNQTLTISIGSEKNSTFCTVEEFFELSQIRDENVYGSSLQCIVQAKCDRNGGEFNSAILTDTHNLTFDLTFTSVRTNQSTTTISPDQPVTLCVGSARLPSPAQADIRFSVSTHHFVDVAIFTPTETSSHLVTDRCSEKRKSLKSDVVSCVRLVLINFDVDNRLPTSVKDVHQVVKVNVSVKAHFSGVNTGGKFVTVESRDLIVNLTASFATRRDFVHVYSRSTLKPAHLPYTWQTNFDIPAPALPTARSLLIMSHKHHNYEIQVKLSPAHNSKDSSLVTAVGIRYSNLVLIIQADSITKQLHHQVHNSASDPFPVTNHLPKGVSIDGDGRSAMTVKLEYFGTMIHLWAYVPAASESDGGCEPRFVQTRSSISSFSCNSSWTESAADGLLAINVMVLPGLSDTPESVNGSIYSDSLDDVMQNVFEFGKSDRYMFGASFISSVNSMSRSSGDAFSPASVSSLCRCGAAESNDSCVTHSSDSAGRRRRSTMESSVRLPARQASSKVESASASSSSRVIAEAEANETCKNLVQEKQVSMPNAIGTCKVTEGILKQVDFVSQFIFVCAKTAIETGSFDSSEQTLRAFLGMCADAISMDETVEEEEKQQTVTRIFSELCPNNCNGRGHCILGSCVCSSGESSDGCAPVTSTVTTSTVTTSTVTTSTPAVTTSSPKTFFASPSAVLCVRGSCTDVIIRVEPPEVAASVTSCDVKFESFNLNLQSRIHQPGVIACNVTRIMDWLFTNNRMFAVVTVSLVANNWVTGNSTKHLMHQEKCDGTTVTCNPTDMNCSIGDSGTEKRNLCQTQISSSDTSQVSVSVIIGFSLAGLLLAALVAVVIAFVCCMKRKESNPADSNIEFRDPPQIKKSNVESQISNDHYGETDNEVYEEATNENCETYANLQQFSQKAPK